MDSNKSVDLIDLDNLLGSKNITVTRHLIDTDGFAAIIPPPMNYTSVDWLGCNPSPAHADLLPQKKSSFAAT